MEPTGAPIAMIATAGAAGLAEALGAECHELTIADVIDGRPVPSMPGSTVVVAVWPDQPGEAALVDIDDAQWAQRFERSFLAWALTLGQVAAACPDGGQVIAVVDRPAPLDGARWAPESAVADAVEAMVRSLSRSEGGRGVRVNTVTSPTRLTRRPVVDPPPPLAEFPGSVGELAAAVQMLIDGGAALITSAAIHADFGRSW